MPDGGPVGENKSLGGAKILGFSAESMVKCVTDTQTDGGQNAEAGPASTREILIPCAGMPAPPLQQRVKRSTSSLFQHPQLPGMASEGWGDPLFEHFWFYSGRKVILSWNRQPRAESCVRVGSRKAMRASVTELLNRASVGGKDAERRSGRRKRVPPRSGNPGLSSEK